MISDAFLTDSPLYLFIDSTLAQYPEPLDSLQQDVLSTLIGPYFAYIALLIQDANELLKAINQTSWLQQKTQDSCGSDCISQKTNDVINEVGHATKTSVLKLGLSTLNPPILVFAFFFFFSLPYPPSLPLC